MSTKVGNSTCELIYRASRGDEDGVGVWDVRLAWSAAEREWMEMGL